MNIKIEKKEEKEEKNEKTQEIQRKNYISNISLRRKRISETVRTISEALYQFRIFLSLYPRCGGNSCQ